MAISFFQEMDDLLSIPRFRDNLGVISEYVSAVSCGGEAADECRDEAAAVGLKLAAIAAILAAGVAGVAIPLVGRNRRLLRAEGGGVILAKAFAAGVILATGFVHMLHDGEAALTDPCLPDTPWRRFPFSGFVAMTAALATLVVDYAGTEFYERKEAAALVAASEEDRSGTAIVSVAPAPEPEPEEDNNDAMHIIRIHAHVAAHQHHHAHAPCSESDSHTHAHGHVRGHGEDGFDGSSHARHAVVSQILELGMVSHSVIIGLSLGVSQSPCTIQPLVAALSFHQFFEGFALGGCISQANFKNLSVVLMASFFAITTPVGIGIGAGVASFYDANSRRALVVEGLLDSVSAGILIYMALVDLIAADLLGRKKLSCDVKVQAASFVALFLGALAMSSLALWA